MCPAWTQTASSWFSAQQQDRSTFYEGGEKLPPSRGAVQKGPGAGAGHGDKVS